MAKNTDQWGESSTPWLGSAHSENRVIRGKKLCVILLDSNIVIYLRQPEFGTKIINLLAGQDVQTCNMVIAEVLGFKDLMDVDARHFSALFSNMKNHRFDTRVSDTVIGIRRSLTIELPDAIIAATALVNDLTLWTHNTDDFNNIPKLQLFDPIST